MDPEIAFRLWLVFMSLVCGIGGGLLIAALLYSRKAK